MTNNAHADASLSPHRGSLYLVATPIGNLEDITLRALRILKEVDQIACEDTRHTLKLLNHFEIHKPLVSYHEHNEITRAPELVHAMEQGASVALAVSDRRHAARLRSRIPAGLAGHPPPDSRDPHSRHRSALITALAASGLPNEEFLFLGFLPARSARYAAARWSTCASKIGRSFFTTKRHTASRKRSLML